MFRLLTNIKKLDDIVYSLATKDKYSEENIKKHISDEKLIQQIDLIKNDRITENYPDTDHIMIEISNGKKTLFRS